MTGDASAGAVQIPDVLPVLALRDQVVFPFVILPLAVGAGRGAAAIDHALAEQRIVMLTRQRDPAVEDPGPEDLSEFGTASLIMRMLKLPDGRTRILVQGLSRARIEHVGQREPFLLARVRRLDPSPSTSRELEEEALMRSVKESLERAAGLGKGISSEVMVIALSLDDAGRLADLAASNLELPVDDAQRLLETLAPVERLHAVHDLLAREIRLLSIQQEISSQAHGEMERSHRDFFLRQQLKAIQAELGESGETAQEVLAYRERLRDKTLSRAVAEEIDLQLQRLARSHPEGAEAAILRTHLDWLTGLPWGVVGEDRLDLERAQQILDEDHYDLEKVKERILEYLAVRRLSASSRGPILCFLGPPGVGKTSLGRSIARAMGRRFVRLSLGGVRDEAEIRGHRRTYVGALPGRILHGIQQAGTSNPVFMLDEIDKLGTDYRGDPSAALLEVLDPEQNSTFRDHYLGVEFDLSRVLFLTTANVLDTIPAAFLDRMEVIRLSGYSTEEKLHIARRHLLPKLLAEHGLAGSHLSFTDAALRRIVRDYTREAGLRNLERELAAVCRKVAVRVARHGPARVRLGRGAVAGFLGPARHFSEELLDRDRVGVATGLAWTAAGGDLLLVEVLAVPGKGELRLTGQLGEVMKESAQAALSYARSYAQRRKLSDSFFSRHDLHIHVPAGSIPKDGPSAGITIATAIVSVLSGRPVDRRTAMTGEITLRGAILPVGGLKEKILAAREAGLRRLLLPRLNERDLLEVPEGLRSGLAYHFVEQMDEVLETALLRR